MGTLIEATYLTKLGIFGAHSESYIHVVNKINFAIKKKGDLWSSPFLGSVKKTTNSLYAN